MDITDLYIIEVLKFNLEATVKRNIMTKEEALSIAIFHRMFLAFDYDNECYRFSFMCNYNYIAHVANCDALYDPMDTLPMRYS